MDPGVLYVKSFVDRRRLAFLPDATRESVAWDCREAALDLLAGIARGWGKRELAHWLVGPYAHATRHSVRGERVAMLDHAHPITEEAVDVLLTRVRAQLVASLEKAALEGGVLDFSEEMLRRGLVTRALGDEGEDVWLPLDTSRSRLRDRVRALFVAHSLNDPASYETLFVCHRCEAVVFDAIAKETGVCNRHRVSGVVPRAELEAEDVNVRRA
jgi:hypothetical protein